jgi:hypothetical protein
MQTVQYSINRHIAVFMLLTAMWCSSCKTTQKTTTVLKPVTLDSVDTQITAQQLLDSVTAHAFTPAYFSAKANVDANLTDDNKNFNVTLRIKNDSAIWISINALLGVEAARVLITKDSLKLIDRIHNKFAIADYEYLSDILRIKVDYNTIQQILLGNFFAYRNENRFNSVYTEDNFFILSTLNKRKLRRSLEDKDPNKPIVQDFNIDPKTYRILNMNVDDDRIKKNMHTEYSNFQQMQQGLLPLSSETTITADQRIGIKINFTKVNTDLAEDMPFRIPANFERIQPHKN